MTYACDDCGFLFRRFGSVSQCPLCESSRVRPATSGETEKTQALFGAGRQAEAEKRGSGREVFTTAQTTYWDK